MPLVTEDESAQLFQGTKAASCLQRRGGLRRSGLVADPGRDAGFSVFQHPQLDR